MAFLNDNYLKLKVGYLFPEIGRRVKVFCDANPEAAKRLIRCGIGDVTEPLPSTAIAAMHNTNLAVVAPGIAEALFATAIGLVAAIPAVLAYNKISTDLSRFASRLEAFGSEFSAILSRQSEERA